MHTLKMLGAISLADAEGREVDALLRQPKHIALLAYIAMPRPGTWHRRDSLLGMFWPELDQARARTSLRSALHTLRKHLPEGAVRSRGDSEVSLDPDLVATDVAAMADHLAAGRLIEALANYRGDLLPALHISDAEDFEKWLGNQRNRLRADAQKTAGQVADRSASAGNLPGAIEAARRAAEIDPDDEVAVRKWISLLDRAGDRSQAFAVYERFRDHVAAEFGVRPSAETVALVDAVRTRRDAAPTPTPPPPPVTANSNAEFATRAAGVPVEEGKRRNKSILWWTAAASGLVGAFALFAGTRWNEEQSANDAAVAEAPAKSLRTLVVLPMEDETNDPAQAYVASGLAEGIARRLEGIGGMTIRSAARSEWPKGVSADLRSVGRKLGSNLLLRTKLSKSGGLLEVRASVVDPETMEEKTVAPSRFAVADIRDVESSIAAAIAGEIFRTPLQAVPRGGDRTIDPESYRLMLEGWHQMMAVRNYGEAKRLFNEAATVDPANSRAWSGLSSAWAVDASKERVPFEIAYERSTVAAERALALDSLDGSAWANLGYLRGVRYRNVSIGTRLIRKAAAADPGNAEIFVILSHLYRSSWEWDKARDAIRVARRLDPLNLAHIERESTIELCAGRPAAALALIQKELEAGPPDPVLKRAAIRSLARLGRYDDAIAAWRTAAAETGNKEIVTALDQARGESGYWTVKYLEGRRNMEALGTRSPAAEPTEFWQMRSMFETGDVEGGYQLLEALVRDKNVSLYRLPCLSWLDPVRGSARFDRVIKQVGPMPGK